jgi:hypothetical protein
LLFSTSPYSNNTIDDAFSVSQGQNEHAPKRVISLKVLLVLFVALIGLPAWGFAGYVAYRYAATERQAIKASGISTVRYINASIDFRLNAIKASAKTLALSRFLQIDDLNSFYEQAQAFAKVKKVSVSLVRPSGDHILYTNMPLGSVFERFPESANIQESVLQNKEVISPLYRNPISNQWVIAVITPVFKNQTLHYLLVVEAPSQIYPS